MIHILPAVNAALNGLAGVWLLAGYAAIKAKRIPVHRFCMLAAFATSSVFLVCYTVYHAQVGSVRFTRTGFVRPVYFAVLITHVTLAAAILPMAIVTLRRGLLARDATHVRNAHVRIARYTFPLWMYVSVTGVLVYVLLYRF